MPTTLNAGDILFTNVLSVSSGSYEDSFSFIATKNIAAGEEITIYGPFSKTTFTVGAGGLSAYERVTIAESSNTMTVITSNGTATASPTNWDQTATSALIAASGDKVITAFANDASAYSTQLSYIQSGDNIIQNSSLTDTEAQATSGPDPLLLGFSPTGGASAMYAGTTVEGIDNPANWEFQGSAEDHVGPDINGTTYATQDANIEATTFDFGGASHVNSAGSGARDLGGTSILASVNDGVISVGDAVTISGVDASEDNVSGISNGTTIYYHGNGVFAGVTGYVFSTSPTLSIPSNLVVFHDSAPSLSTTIAVGEYASGFTPQVLGTSPACFAAGTEIATPNGPVLVETLSVGDEVLNSAGEPVPVKWIGRQTVSTRFGPAERLMPVRFSAGALGDGLPHADLTVTSDHGMLVDGVICNAAALVNGTTITRVPLAEMGDTYTVYHIETEAHEIILANGAPAETFIDNVSRRVFDNYAEFEALYGDVPEMEELPYPRAMSARQLPTSIKAKLATQKAA